IRVSLIPEGGRVVPGLENRIFVAAIYPDGSPASCDVKLRLRPAKNEPLEMPRRDTKDKVDLAMLVGLVSTTVITGDNADKPDKKPADEPIAKVRTNEAGLAEFTVTPKPEQFSKADWSQQNIEMLGGQQRPWWGQKSYLDIEVEVTDKKGPTIAFVTRINA